MGRSNFQEIKTDRLLLRKLRQSDWKMISFLRTDKAVNKFVNRPDAATKEKAMAFISKINNGIEHHNWFYWAIALSDEDPLIGTICLWNFSADKKTTEIGFELSPNFQKRGFMTECVKRVLDFGFSNLKLDLITAYTNKENEGAKKALEKCGFRLNPYKKDEFVEDNVVYELKRP